MKKLTEDYRENVRLADEALRVSESFDILKKTLTVGGDEATLYYIDGFTKDTVMQKLMMHFISVGELSSAEDFMTASVPYIETEVTENFDSMLTFVLSGCTLMLGSTFGSRAIIIDSRTYPARETGEPESDKVVRGPKDGFVETLIFNTALIRRRVRDTRLTMKHMSLGESSKTDVVVCYLDGVADASLVAEISGKLSAVKTDSLTMGHQSLSECLIRRKWYNPFPKMRSTERPDAAVAELLEGKVLVIVDNTPEVIVLPTTIFDFMQETNDFYFPPLTGTYIRLLRHFVFWVTLFAVPLWFTLVRSPELIPPGFGFIIPREPGNLPLIVQVLMVEFIIDVLRLASMNTPNMLTNSLSVVGGLILGEFAVSAGWLTAEVILLGAFVAIANFTQRSLELGYAFKLLRILTVILAEFFGIWGFLAGVVVAFTLLASNKTATPRYSYLYPLIPFKGRALLSLYFRLPKGKK